MLFSLPLSLRDSSLIRGSLFSLLSKNSSCLPFSLSPFLPPSDEGSEGRDLRE